MMFHLLKGRPFPFLYIRSLSVCHVLGPLCPAGKGRGKEVFAPLELRLLESWTVRPPVIIRVPFFGRGEHRGRPGQGWLGTIAM